MWCGSQKKYGRSLARILTFPRSRIRTRIIKDTETNGHARRACDLPREIAAEVLGRLVPYAFRYSPASHPPRFPLERPLPSQLYVLRHSAQLRGRQREDRLVPRVQYDANVGDNVSPPYHHVRARESFPRYQCVPRRKSQRTPGPPRSRKRLLASTPLPSSQTPSMRSSVRACGRTCCSFVIFIPFAVCSPLPQTILTSYSIFVPKRHDFYCFGHVDLDDARLLGD